MVIRDSKVFDLTSGFEKQVRSEESASPMGAKDINIINPQHSYLIKDIEML